RLRRAGDADRGLVAGRVLDPGGDRAMNITALPTGRRGQVLAAAIGVLGLAVLWLAAADPLLSFYQDQARALTQRQALLDRMQVVADSLPAWSTAAARKPADGGSALLSGTSDAVAAAGLQETVQRMAAAAGTTLTAVETLPAEADGRWHRVSLRISLNAPWPALMELIRQVDQARARIFIDDLHFHSPVIALRPRAVPIQASMVVYGFRAGS
ncbi:MAG TPA: type II secretion system protein GspM, partial [Rhodopila sp.]|nr:type II secretion system protein GspM [Rhodopila sp.]